MQLVGKITHYFDKIGVAVIQIVDGQLKIGDNIVIKSSENEFEQTIDSMQIDHNNVDVANQGESVGFKVIEPVKEGDEVFKA